MNKVYYCLVLFIVLFVSFLGITYSFEYADTDNIVFELVGSSTEYVLIGTDYKEKGIKVLFNNRDVSDKVIISGNIDTTALGNYKVKYQYDNEYIYRNVMVIDNVAPKIELIGGEEVYLLLGGSYQESGYRVSDNYDDVSNIDISVTGNVNTSLEGEYYFTYTARDSSDNVGSVKRKIVVVKSVISTSGDTSGRVSASLYNVSLYSNTLIKNKFNDDGVYFYGYVKDNANNYKIKLINRDNKVNYTYNMSSDKKNYYGGNLNLSMVDNGVYDVYVIGKKEERLLNKLDVYSRIVRAKVGNKLVTFNYDNDNVSIIIEDFQYKYDFVIDPGHGGIDTGASNGIVNEKDINLMVSKYEKCRYESMNYRVYMIRYDDSYGEMIGSSSLDNLDRRALTTGYYGSVSRVTYSNHHNASLGSGEHGFEILVQGGMTRKQLNPEFAIYDKFKRFYRIDDNKIRMYSKDYDTHEILDKYSGKVYSNKNYYSVLRIPYELFNVKNVIYEPIYITNANDFNWYYAGKNWVKVSEIKIREYVNAIGGTYNSDNSMCI